MQTIIVSDKYDFNDLLNILVKNKYKVEARAMSLNEDKDVELFEINFEQNEYFGKAIE